MSKLICVLSLLFLPFTVWAKANPEFCNLLDEQESHLTEKEKKTLEEYGFVSGTARVFQERKYPEILVSKAVEKDCKARYVVASYFSDKISGKEYFMKKISLSEDDRKILASASCKALELTTNGSGVWADGMEHEIENVVNDIIFPYFFSCISDRIAQKKSIGSEYFSDGAFRNPNKRLVDQIYNSVLRSPSNYRPSSMAERLFILKNGSQLSGLNTESMLRSGPNQNTNLPREDVIRIAEDLLRQKEKISLEQYRDFEHKLWGY